MRFSSLGKVWRVVLAVIVVLIACSGAWATQEHADPEGLVSHQLAHLFFMVSMAVLIVQIRRTSPLPKGWRYIGIAAFLFLLWNINTFTVHWIRETIPPGVIRGEWWVRQIDISTLKAKMVYAGKMLDHFLLVGAMAAFLMGIRTFKQGMKMEGER